MLLHVSEQPDIARFEPRASEYATGLVVWAIEERRLCNYLVPRECPRVTYYAGADTTAADVERFRKAAPRPEATPVAKPDPRRSARVDPR